MSLLGYLGVRFRVISGHRLVRLPHPLCLWYKFGALLALPNVAGTDRMSKQPEMATKRAKHRRSGTPVGPGAQLGKRFCGPLLTLLWSPTARSPLRLFATYRQSEPPEPAWKRAKNTSTVTPSGPGSFFRGNGFGDFGPPWVRFGPALGPLRARPFGRAEAHCGRGTGPPGPKDDRLWSQDPSRRLRGVSVSFQFWARFWLPEGLACCVLAAC